MAGETQDRMQQLIDLRAEMFRFLGRELRGVAADMRRKADELDGEAFLGAEELLALREWLGEQAQFLDDLQRPMAEVAE
jgi:hypothetical protein